MRIGCDLDGVIINHNYNKSRLLKGRGVLKKFSINDDTKKIFDKDEYSKFTNELYGSLSLKAQEVYQAKKTIKKLISIGNEIRIISRRDHKNREFALGWLKNKQFTRLIPEACIHFVDSDKQKDLVCRKFGIDLHIDDSVEVINNLTVPHYKILFSTSLVIYPSATFIAKSWKDVLKYIKGI